MVHKTVLRVDISNERWKKKILKAVSGIPGVDIVETDAAKGTLTVTGAADPYEVILRTKRTGKCVEVVSIGPPSAPPKPTEPKKPEEKKQEEKKLSPEKKSPDKKPEEKKVDEKKPEQKAQVQQQFQLQVQPQLQLMPQPQFMLQPQPLFQPHAYSPPPYMAQNFYPPYMGYNNPACDRVKVIYVAGQDQPNPSCTIM